MSLLPKFFARKDDRAPLRPLYDAVVERARAPHWYVEGAVADEINGRFDMVTAILACVLIRLDSLEARGQSAKLIEIFIEDMDGQIRQIGFGDLVVGKQIGQMMGALGGRRAAYAAALTGEEPLDAALLRNLYRGEAPAPAALAHVESRLRTFFAGLTEMSLEELIAGQLPR